jgi:predicted O-methyltransferase YrrM
MAAKCELLATYGKTGEIRTHATLACRIDDQFGLWLSLVERLVRDQEAVGSNPTSPILWLSSQRMQQRLGSGRSLFVYSVTGARGLRHLLTPVGSPVVSSPDFALTNSAHADQILDLMARLMDYRSQDVRDHLEKVRRKTSMLHLDVLLLIYHFAKICAGNILEIGPYVGGSTIAAALGVRDSNRQKKIVTIEAGGRLKHSRLPSRNIIKDLKKNLARFGVLEDVTLIEGRSAHETMKSAVRQIFGSGEVGLFIFDADGNPRRDLNYYGDLLMNHCWVVIDDYFGPGMKAAPIRAQVDEMVSEGKLLPLGYYGWSTWIGQWQRK